MRKKYKFKTLLNEYRYLSKELRYIDEILVEASKEFEIYHREYCKENNIDLANLNKVHSKEVKKILSNNGAILKSLKTKEYQKEYDSKDIFRTIARKFHPDVLTADDPNKSEYEDVFKRASAAIDEGNWGELFDIVDEYDLDLKDYESAIASLKKDIKRTQEKIQSKKDMYSYLLYECEDDKNCKDNLIKRFLKHLFNI